MNNIVYQMTVEAAECLLKQLCDAKNVTSDYLSSNEGKFSWVETTEKTLCVLEKWPQMMLLKVHFLHLLINCKHLIEFLESTPRPIDIKIQDLIVYFVSCQGS